MSDKDRKKKDGQDKNKKIQARHADNFNPQNQRAAPAQEAKDASNLTDTAPGASDRRERRRSAARHSG